MVFYERKYPFRIGKPSGAELECRHFVHFLQKGVPPTKGKPPYGWSIIPNSPPQKQLSVVPTYYSNTAIPHIEGYM